MDKNLNDLINASKAKLDEQNSHTSNNPDIYAEMRQEINQEQQKYQDITLERPPYPPLEEEQNYHIDYRGEQEFQGYVDQDDEVVFEGGPSISTLALWKKQYTNEKIFHVEILNRHFIFRTLNRFEYKQIVALQNLDALQREEVICKTCVLFPYQYNPIKMAVEDGGYPSTLAQIIMENSGFTKEYGIEIL